MIHQPICTPAGCTDLMLKKSALIDSWSKPQPTCFARGWENSLILPSPPLGWLWRERKAGAQNMALGATILVWCWMLLVLDQNTPHCRWKLSEKASGGSPITRISTVWGLNLKTFCSLFSVLFPFQCFVHGINFYNSRYSRYSCLIFKMCKLRVGRRMYASPRWHIYSGGRTCWRIQKQKDLTSSNICDHLPFYIWCWGIRNIESPLLDANLTSPRVDSGAGVWQL